jgi:exopolysaccharide biosynthesis protein
LGYESPSGNVKGPRGCLWYDKEERTAGIGVSMGRNFLGGGTWGPGLFPEASDVVCAGPILVSGGQNVFWQQYELEDFGTSGISPSSPLPRSAICILDDGSIMVLAAQNDTVKARGFTLPELADYMISQGCVEALNLDGGGSSAFWASSPGAGYWPGTEDRAVYTAVICK